MRVVLIAFAIVGPVMGTPLIAVACLMLCLRLVELAAHRELAKREGTA